MHSITTLALRNFHFDGRSLQFLHAYNGAEGIAMVRDNPDLALCLLDVVMETDHAGLDMVEVIRDQLRNSFTRIVLRTGQPGQAPEETIIADYDINDYKEKNELTRGKMHTLLYSCLRSYRDILALERNRQGLERILDASTRLQQHTFIQDFAHGILEQISAILSPDEDALYALCEGVAAHEQFGRLMVVAGTRRVHPERRPTGVRAVAALGAAIRQKPGRRLSLATARKRLSVPVPLQRDAPERALSQRPDRAQRHGASSAGSVLPETP